MQSAVCTENEQRITNNFSMHILYVHQNFPAQFGHIAKHLVQKLESRPLRP